MSSHPHLGPQPEIVERLAAVIPDPESSQYVANWLEDERDFYRDGDDWHSFTQRTEMLGRIRRVKAAKAVLDVLAEAGLLADHATLRAQAIAAQAVVLRGAAVGIADGATAAGATSVPVDMLTTMLEQMADKVEAEGA